MNQLNRGYMSSSVDRRSARATEKSSSSHTRSVLSQLTRYSAVGTLNILVDFAALNLLLLVLEPVHALLVTLCSAISYLLSTVNSYFWNHRWTFRQAHARSRLWRFLILNTVALGLNSAIVLTYSALIYPSSTLSVAESANLSKLLATVACGLLTFTGNRYWVFRLHRQMPAAAADQPEPERQPSA